MKLVLTNRARSDVEAIAAYIPAESPEAALRVEAALQAAVALIAAFPFVGHETKSGVRRFAVPRLPYPVFYGVDEFAGEVRIFTIRHTARRPES